MSLNFQSVFHIASNDQRLLWRELNSTRFFSLRAIASVVVLFAIIQLPVWAVAAKMARLGHQPPVMYLALGWLGVFGVMVAGCMTRVPMVLYDEKDLQLLLSSPLAPRAVIGARLISIALSCFFPAGLPVAPITNALVFHVGLRFAAGYFLLPVLSVIAAAIAIIFVATLERSFGMKACRIVAQGLPALVLAMPGGIVAAQFSFPGLDVPNLLTALHAVPALSILGRAAAGGVIEIGVSLLVLAVSWTTATVVMERTFLIGAQGLSSIRERRRDRSRPYHWREGLIRTCVLKELRLLARHPQLPGQAFALVFLIFLTAPLLIKLWGWVASIPLALLFISSMAVELAYDSVEAEAAWELVVQSAVGEEKIRALKTGACSIFPLSALLVYSAWIGIAMAPMIGVAVFLAGILLIATSAWLILGRVSFLTRRTLTRWRAPRNLRTYLISQSLAVLAAGPAMLLHSAHWVFAVAAFVLFGLCIFACFAGMQALGWIYTASSTRGQAVKAQPS